MDRALMGLATAFDHSLQARGGNLGGLRTQIYDDIATAARDIIDAMNAFRGRGQRQ